MEDELAGIPIVLNDQNNVNQPNVIFILERASLENAYVGNVLH